jgi:hypothetical protein
VRQVVQVRLEANTFQLDVLARTLVACNQTANLIAQVARAEGVYRSPVRPSYVADQRQAAIAGFGGRAGGAIRA